jgi:hypothetical protein
MKGITVDFNFDVEGKIKTMGRTAKLITKALKKYEDTKICLHYGSLNHSLKIEAIGPHAANVLSKIFEISPSEIINNFCEIDY